VGDIALGIYQLFHHLLDIVHHRLILALIHMRGFDSSSMDTIQNFIKISQASNQRLCQPNPSKSSTIINYGLSSMKVIA
jgi:hypothetical protein